LAGVPWSGHVESARCFAAGEISLPIHPYLTDQEAGEVARICNAWTP
jgi:dTDP-4-amino-4,6-dideoxygalactose transaminase